MEKREHERFPVRQFQRSFKLYKSRLYHITNISKSGCFMESRDVFPASDGRIAFDLPLPARADGVTLAAKIVWETKSIGDNDGKVVYQYGLSFEDMDNVSTMILDAYLDFLRRDVHIAQLEQAWQKLKKVQERIEILIACEEKKSADFIH